MRPSGWNSVLERPRAKSGVTNSTFVEGEHADRHPLVVRRLTWFEPHPCVELAWHGCRRPTKRSPRRWMPIRNGKRTTGLTSLDEGHGEHEPEART